LGTSEKRPEEANVRENSQKKGTGEPTFFVRKKDKRTQDMRGIAKEEKRPQQ